ncbi:hypothetical protein ACXYMO_04765 [Arenibacterium sp. CAU 1754]
MTEQEFDAMPDADKVQFLGAALIEANEALQVANELNQQLHEFNGELLAAIKGEESHV